MQFKPHERDAIGRWRVGETRINRFLAWLVISWSQRVMTRHNRLTVDGLERLEALFERGDRGLLTYSNHVSRLDDPLLVSNFGLADLPYDRMRWVAADALKLFSTRLSAFIFSAGKCVPIVRGGGLDQPGLDFLSQRLSDGDWVHIFPEGGASRDPEGWLRHPFKIGIGRLIAETQPLTLPFYHSGMQRVAPHRSRPRRGHHVHVLFGESKDCDARFVQELGGGKPRELWQKITDWSHTILNDLEQRVR
ncbi:MAG: lysophospholipid acyltransferase family protein [Acidobacteriota bacterium]